MTNYDRRREVSLDRHDSENLARMAAALEEWDPTPLAPYLERLSESLAAIAEAVSRPLVIVSPDDHDAGEGPSLDVEGAAKYLGASERQVREWVYRRTIPHYKVGRLLRFSVADLDEWLQQNHRKADG